MPSGSPVGGTFSSLFISRTRLKTGHSWETFTKRTERRGKKNLSVQSRKKKSDDKDRELLFYRDNFRVSVAMYFTNSWGIPFDFYCMRFTVVGKKWMLLGNVRQMVPYSLTKPSQILQAQDLKDPLPKPWLNEKIIMIKQGKTRGDFGPTQIEKPSEKWVIRPPRITIIFQMQMSSQ